MNEEIKFRTKTGYCHILPDKIVLTRDGIIGNLAKVTMGNNISRPLIIYGLFSILLIYYAFDSFKKEDNISAIFFVVIAVFLVYGILRSRKIR